MERYALVFFYLQGGGLYILGTATLTNTNVYKNQATTDVSYLLKSSPYIALCLMVQRRWNVTRAHVWQYGGGLHIRGAATLTNTKVYENEANNVCFP